MTAALAATMQLLAEHGFDGFELADVARVAKVHKTTVYRRWPTKMALVADLLNQLALQNVPIPDTGRLVTDLEAILENVVALVNTRLIRVVIGAALTASESAELDTARASFWQKRFALGVPVVDRAVQRGELPAGTDGRRLLEHLAGPIYLRLLLTGGAVTLEDIRLTISITLRAFSSGCRD